MSNTIKDQMKRYSALGLMKIHTNCGNTTRWLVNDSEIEFTAVNEQNDFNYEFEINGSSNHLIWFSQISGVHLNPDDVSQFTSPTINWKDGTQTLIIDLFPMEFWQKVKGKRFKVLVESDFPIMIDKWNPMVQELGTIKAVTDYIAENLDNENYDAVNGMTKAATAYAFVEV